jgi:hypothetical protein
MVQTGKEVEIDGLIGALAEQEICEDEERQKEARVLSTEIENDDPTIEEALNGPSGKQSTQNSSHSLLSKYIWKWINCQWEENLLNASGF